MSEDFQLTSDWVDHVIDPRRNTCYIDSETGDVVWEFNKIRAADFFLTIHKAANCQAMWLLSSCYLPGCIAGWIQILRSEHNL